MTVKKEISWKIFFSLVLIIFSINLFAQNEKYDKSELSKNMSGKLQQKMLLSDEQVKKVENILSEYITSENPNSDQASADKKIEALLDEKQKAKFEIIKNDWWNEVNKAAFKR
jgi:hypothetical protein